MEFYVVLPLARVELPPFQFPMGWNSTLWISNVFINAAVSIPNGMEFYNKEAKKHISSNNVSIPNGMEFYLLFEPQLNARFCFNSQ